MSKKLLSMLFILSIMSIKVCHGQYFGGNATGDASVKLSSSVCYALDINPYSGGGADGQSSLSLTNSACVSLDINPYLGGRADGQSSLSLTNSACVSLDINPYAGGNADGHSSVQAINVSILMCYVSLPIELLNFDAQLDKNIVNITWQTASETNSDYFVIEKTRGDNRFESVAKIKGAGNSSQTLNYKAIDNIPYTGVSYYRLKQYDFDGNFTISNLAPINYLSDIAAIFPNPVAQGNNLILLYSTGTNDELQVTIRDIMGQTVYQNKYELKKEGNKFSIETSAFAGGVYLVSLKSALKENVMKVVVTK